jgi:hypothetical protein
LHGVACLLFGVGTAGVDWLARLACSGWFVGLEPRAGDIVAAGGLPHGGWAMPASGASADEGDLLTAAEGFFTSVPLPSAWYAAVAIPRGAGLEEWSATLGLVGALRERSDPLGRKLTVIATVDTAPGLASAPFVRRLLDRGAFVVCADPDAPSASGDHLHHFPLRAAVIPRQGRLICVDLADYLHTWRPGRIERWLAKFGHWHKWNLCLKAAMMPPIRSTNGKTSETDPQPAFQGESGTGCDQG